MIIQKTNFNVETAYIEKNANNTLNIPPNMVPVANQIVDPTISSGWNRLSIFWLYTIFRIQYDYIFAIKEKI